MGKLIASINLTRDGFLSRADGSMDWHFNYWDEQMCERLCKQLSTAEILLLGANTYSTMASYWAEKGSVFNLPRQDIVLAELMHKCTKVVVSSTIRHSSWEKTIFLSGELVQQITSLKVRTDRNIVVLGSIQLLHYLAKFKLIDRYELWIHPLEINKGVPFPIDLQKEKELKLTKSLQLDSGVVQLSYALR